MIDLARLIGRDFTRLMERNGMPPTEGNALSGGSAASKRITMFGGTAASSQRLLQEKHPY